MIYDDKQKEAIISCFNNKITVVTGPAGSGKTTICKAIINIAQSLNKSIRVMAPTGKAAQVLTKKTGYPAETIHRALKMTPDDNYPKELISDEFVIIDESSMLGVDTIYSIMCAIENNLNVKVVFVGDANQLPSVSPGNFLSDIMASGCANVIRLDTIHRQDERSYIALLANEISKGKIVDVPSDASDIKFHDLSKISDFKDRIEGIAGGYLLDKELDNLQFLSCMYKGNYGVNFINNCVQEEVADLNCRKHTVLTRTFGKFYEGDRVIQTENNYDKEIFNGDMGYIVSLGRKVIDADKSDEKDDFVTVSFFGKRVTFVGSEIDQLKLAWCCTVHKFQGSQADNVVFVFPRESSIMESKEILYTAMTRAAKRLDIYGHLDTFRGAPTKSVIRKRYSNTNNIIKEKKENVNILKVSV